MKTQPPPQLIEAKFFPNAVANNPIKRPRLEPPALILEGRRSVAAIVAPAGYGKSTLMACWAERLREAGVTCAWLTLDENDNDSIRLLNYLIAALRLQNPETFAKQADPQVGASELGLRMQSLAADLAASGQRLCLFLDDLHVLHEPDALQSVQWLIDYAPSHMQFVLGARELSRLRLGGLRVSGRLLEIDWRQLTFDMEEAERFYGARLSLALTAGELTRLMEKTEGWPVGLQLAALALEGEQHRQELIDSFTGTDLSVVDYLGDVMLNRQDDATQRFLYVVAQFDRVNGALAAAASGQADARERLADLYARGMFLIALDRRGEWFRFHHLAGEFLRGHTPPGLPPDTDLAAEALLRGAHWLREQGLIEDAITCAIRARQWEPACAWLSEYIAEAVNRGSHRLLLRWIGEIPPPWLNRYPVITVHHAFMLTLTIQHRDAGQQFARIESALASMDGSQVPDAVRCSLELERVLLTAVLDNARQASDLASRWLKRWPDAPASEHCTCQNVKIFACKCLGELDAGLALVARNRQMALDSENFYVAEWSDSLAALLHMRRGDYAAARACCERGLAVLNEHLAEGSAHRYLLDIPLAATAYELNETTRAREALDLALPYLQDAVGADWLILACLTQARLMMLNGDAKNAMAVLHKGQATARDHRRLPRVEITLAAEECVWLCRRGQWEKARALARRHGLERMADPALPHTVASTKSWHVGARLGLMDEPENTARTLAPAIADAHARGLAHRETELHLLRAAALHASGQNDEMREALAAAARLGQTHGYRRVFLDDADLLHPLLTRGGNDDVAWLRSLLKTGGAPARAPQPDTEFTKREQRIMATLESDLSNSEMAELLFISEATLKWHLHNIYGKLGVRNRSGAIAAAKQLQNSNGLS